MRWLTATAVSARLRAGAAAVATLALVASGLVVESGVDADGAWGAPTRVASNLLINLDGNDTTSLAASSPTSWNSIAPASSLVSSTLRNVTRYNSGGIGGLTLPAAGQAAGGAAFVAGTGAVAGAQSADMWINPSNLNTGWNIIASRWFSDSAGSSAAVQDWHFAIFVSGSTGLLRLDTTSRTGSNPIYGSQTFPTTGANVWYHVGFTIDASGNAQLYVNGRADGSATVANAITGSSSAQLWVGDQRGGMGSFPGVISKFRIYNTALTAAQMQQNYQAEGSLYGYPVVTFKSNYSGGPADTFQNVGYNVATALTGNTFTRTGYSFAGWATNANGTGTTYANGANITTTSTSGVDLYAQWALNPVSPTVSGTPRVGQALTGTAGVSTAPSVTSSYQWQRSVDGSTGWTDIAGATAISYTAVTADAGNFLRLRQTITDGTVSASGTSTNTTVVLSANSAAATAGVNNAVTDLIPAVPNDSNVVNVTIVSSNLSTGRLKWNATPANLTGVLGADPNTTGWIPKETHSSTWATAGFPILSFRGTGADVRTAMATLNYTSTTVQTDTLRIYVNSGSSQDAHALNYIPIVDNGNQLTFHYYAFQTQTARIWTDTQAYLQGLTDIGTGVVSPNKWHLMTPRYWIEDSRGWGLSAWAGRPAANNVLLGGTANAGSSSWYYPAGTDGYTSQSIFSVNATAQTGFYGATWYPQDAGTSVSRGMEYWCNSCTMSNGNISGTGTFFAWDDIPRDTTAIGAYIAETWSSTPLATSTSSTAAQTVRTVVGPDAPTGLSATPSTSTSVTLNWTAPASTGTDPVTDYTIQTSSDQSTWTTFADGVSSATTATVTGLMTGQTYWFRVAAVTSTGGAYSTTASAFTTLTGNTNALGGYSVPSNLTGTIRVLLWSSNPNGKLSVTSATNIDGGIRNTANYPDTNAYTPINGFNPATILSAGRMIGLVDTSASELNAALATLKYSSATASTDTIRMWVSNGTEYIPIANGSNVEFHYYGYVGSSQTWANARNTSNAGAARTIDGESLAAGTSFLATARYRAEDLYLKSLNSSSAWLSAADFSTVDGSNAEGSWKWYGADANGNTGVQFWSGGQAGSSVGGEYQNWVASAATTLLEPNGGTGENCLGYNGGGTFNTAPTSGVAWNDFGCTGTTTGYYWEAFKTGAPYGSNTSNPGASNYAAPAVSSTISVAAPVAAPTGLTATSATAGQIDLSWTAPAGVNGITSYSIQTTTDGSTWTETRTTASTATTHTLTGLTSGTYYHIRVAAITANGTGSYASTYFTPNGGNRISATTNTAKTITTMQVDTAIGSTRYVRVVLRATNAGATLKLAGSTANIGAQRGTANAASLSAAGQMIGLTGTVANVNLALQGLSYTGPGSATTDSIAMWVSAGTTASTPRDFVPVVNSRGEVEFHYFGFTNSTLTWQGAFNAAAADSTQINGVNAPGKFLATLESLDQQVAAMQYYTNGAWLGGGDYTAVNSANADGAWYWLGPDTGVTQFYSGSNASGTGGIVGGSFVAWGASNSTTQQEPNNGVQQNCLATIATPNALTNSGFVAVSAVGGYAWDDGSCTSTQSSYVWEYVSNEPVGGATPGDNYATMTAQAVVVNPNADAPTAVTANAAGSTAVAVGWTSPTVYDSNPLTGYTVQYSTSSSFTSPSSFATGSTSPFALVTGLTANTTYYFRVFATGSGWTGLTSAATGAVTTPSSATSITIVSSGGAAASAYSLTGGIVTVKTGTSVSINAADVVTQLGARDVQIAADSVTINAALAWTANTRLTLGLSSASTVNVNADISSGSATAGVAILPAACAFSSAGSYSGCYSLDVKSGANIALSGATPTLAIGGQAYTVLNTAAQVRALSSNAGTGLYAVTNDVDLSGTTATTSIAFASGFSGTFDGLGNTVRGITSSGSSSFGFMQSIQSPGVVRNLGVNANITLTAPGATAAIVGGGLAGFVGTAGNTTIDQVWTTGSIQTGSGSYGAISAGGLVGNAWGSSLRITRSWSSMNIDTSATPTFSNVALSGGGSQATGPCLGIGGLVGTNTGSFCTSSAGANISVEQVYSTGSLKRGAAPTWHGVGGLFGVVTTGSTVSATDAFTWGRYSSTDSLASVGGMTGFGTASYTRTYTSHSACAANTTATGCTSSVRPGTTGTYSTAAWTSTNGTTLANLASPTIALFVRPTAPSDGSAATVGYSVTDAAGNDYKSLMGTTGYPTLSGAPTWDTITTSSGIGSYSVTYASGLSLTGSGSSAYTLNAAPTGTTIAITKVAQTITWSPTTALVRTDSGTVLPAATTDGAGAISYAVSAGTASCAFNATTRALTFTASGTCDITVTAAATSTNLQATLTRTFTIGTAAPLAPTGLTVSAGVADGRLDVSWTAPATTTTGGTIASYTVEYSSDGTAWTTVSGILTTSTTIAGLTNGTAYTVRVRAVNSEAMTGANATSSPATPYWLPINTSVPTITGTAAGGLSLTAADGTWSANGGTVTATTYQWQRNVSGTWSNIPGATGATYTVSSANDTGAVLRVLVSKTNGANGSAYVSASSGSTATVRSGLASAPTIGTVTPGNRQLTVTWSAPSTTNGGTISSYTLKVSTDGATWQSGLTGVSPTATSATIPALTNGTAYFVQVLAVTAAGDGQTAATTTASTPATTATNTIAPAVTGTAAAGVALTAGNGTWTDGGAIVTYSYQWQSSATAGGSFADIAGATAATYTPVAADVGRFLRVTVTATNSAGATAAVSAATSSVQSGLAAAPTALASSAGNGQLSVTWTAPTVLNGGAISTYNVYVATAGSGNWSLVTRAATTTAAQVVTGLVNGTGYDVKVEAVTGAGVGAAATLSASASTTPFTTPLNTAPPTIAGTAARAITLTAANGTWDGYGRVITYSYQWQVSDGGTGPWVNILGATSPSYTVASAYVGSTIRVRVSADNSAPAAGNAVSSPTAIVQSGLADAPAITSVARGDRQLSVNWTAPGSTNGGTITSYTLQYTSNQLDWQTASSSISPSATSATITGLNNGTGYFVRVFATTAAGDGAIATSNAATVPSTVATNTALPAVTGTAAVGVLLSATSGTWTDGGASVAYTYRWQSAATASGSFVDIAGATAATYTPTVADAGTVVRVVVTATNSAGAVSASSSATSAVQSGRAGAPSGLTPTAGDGSIALSWTAPSALNGGTISNYAIDWAVAGSGNWVSVSRVGSTAASQTITGLSNGTAYDLRVAAITAAGVGAAATYSATIASTPFTTPVNGVIPSVTGTVAVARTLSASTGSWTEYGHPATYSYQWQRSVDGLQGWTDVSGATASTYTVREADRGLILRVRVTADNGASSTAAVASLGTSAVQSGLASAPQNLVVTRGDRQLSVAWSAPESANGGIIRSYTVQASTDWVSWTSPTTVSVSGTSATVTGLSNGTGYVVRVFAVTDAGDGAAISTPTTTVPSTSPSNTTVPSLPATPAVGVALTAEPGGWNNGGASVTYGYQWQRASTSAGPFADIAGATGATYTPVAGDEGLSLRVAVTATNVAGTATVASEASDVVRSGLAGAPTGLSSTAGDGQLTISWAAPAELNGGAILTYNVYTAVAGSLQWIPVDRPGSTTPEQTIGGLSNGVAYDLRVEAVTAAGAGASLIVSASTDSTPFGTPSNIELPEVSGSAAVGRVLSSTVGTWITDGHAATTSIHWQRSNDGGQSWSDIVGATEALYTVQPIDFEAQLRVRVTAANGSAIDGVAVSNATMTVDTGLPDAPTIHTAERGDGSVALGWSAPSALNGGVIHGFTVQLSTDGVNWTTATETLGADADDVLVTGLTNGTGYLFRVFAVSAAGDGAAGATGDYVIPATAPSNTVLPTVLGTPAVARALTSSAGDWSDNGDALSLSYQWQSAPNAEGPFVDIPGAVAERYVPSVTDVGSVLRLRATATNAMGATSAYSEPSGSVASGLAAAPGALTASFNSAGSLWIDTAWEAPNDLGGAIGITGYVLEYRAEGASTWVVAADDLPSDEYRTTVTGIAPGLHYEFRLAARTAAGIGDYAQTAGSVLFGGAPGVVVAAQMFGHRGVGETLRVTETTWDDFGVALTGETIQWQRLVDGEWVDIAGATESTYTLDIEDAETEVRAAVTATNQVGSTTTVVNAGLIGTAIPTEPLDVTVIDGDALISVIWSAPADLRGGVLRGYRVELNDGSGWGNLVREYPVTALGAVIGDLVNARSYDVRVRALTSRDGEPVTFTGRMPYTVPSSAVAPALSGLVAVGEMLEVTDGEWSANGRALLGPSFQWQSSTDGGQSWNDVPDATAATFRIPEGSAGAQFRALVTQRNAAGPASAPTEPTEAAQSGLARAPSAIGVTRGDQVISLTWNVPTELNGGILRDYLVEYRASGSESWQTASRAISTEPSHTIAGLTNAREYEFRVSAVTGIVGEPSEVTTAVPAGNPIVASPATIADGVRAVGYELIGTPAEYIVNDAGSVTIAHRWEASPDGISDWTAVPGATSASFTPGEEHAGVFLRYVSIASNSVGATASVSAPTAVIGSGLILPPADIAVADGAGSGVIDVTWTPPTGLDLNGAVLGGFVLEYSADESTWTRVPSTVAPDQSSARIDGLANGTSYRVRMLAVSTLGVEGPASEPTAEAVPYAAPINLAAPLVSGTAARGYALSTDEGSWNANGRDITTVTVQWEMSESDGAAWTDIPGATEWTFTPGESHVGALVRSRVTVRNLAGSESFASAATAAIASAVADAPTALSVEAGDGSLLVTWAAPEQLNGGTIVDYVVDVTSDGANWTTVNRASSTDTRQLITGLSNDTSYRVRVAARTTVLGVAAESATDAIPYGRPVPTELPTVFGSARIGDTLFVTSGSWNANGRELATAQTQWQVSSDGGASWTDIAGATSTSYVPSGVLGKLVRAAVTRANLAGSTTAVSAPTEAIEIGTPGAPTDLAARPGDLVAVLTWTAPTWLADGSIADYTIEINDGSGWRTVPRTPTATASQTVSGLVDGADYEFRVRTETGRSSLWSSPVSFRGIAKPSSVSPPVITGTPLAGQVLSSSVGGWEGRELDRAHPLIQWQQSFDGGSTWADVPGATGPTVVAASGRVYRTQVTMSNPAGSTMHVSEATPFVVSVRPSGVRALTVAPGDHSLAVSWTAPAALGGGTVSEYRVSYSVDGDTWVPVPRTDSLAAAQVIDGLSNGTDYYVRVQAVTTVTGSWAFASGVFRPFGAPIAQGSAELITGTPTFGQTVLASSGSWDFNGSEPAQPSFQWQASSDGGVTWRDIVGATRASLFLDGYVGDIIRVRVTANNVAGQTSSVDSVATSAVAPIAPSAPQGLTAIPRDGQLELHWSAPNNLGGTPLVGYTVQLSTDRVNWTSVSRNDARSTSETITGVTNGTEYHVRVRAETARSGNWVTSESTLIPFGLPLNTAAPVVSGVAQFDSDLSATAGTWNTNGSSTTVSYQWQLDAGAGWRDIAGATS
ncbi:MAG TPA: fibronectin type III domain-containing protein, partial [Microbacteriaceae bacterium]|nr:fibronectin type III domain-containing protein [Microbacteriaceae bacterium]